MQNAKHKLTVYGKMYGFALPTMEKIENAGVVTEIITEAYKIGVSDAVEHADRLQALEKIVIDGYNTPGEFQDWLVDSVRKAYKTGYEERSEK